MKKLLVKTFVWLVILTILLLPISCSRSKTEKSQIKPEEELPSKEINELIADSEPEPTTTEEKPIEVARITAPPAAEPPRPEAPRTEPTKTEPPRTEVVIIDTVKTDPPKPSALIPEKKPIDTVLSAFNSRVINKITYSNGRIFAADASGNIYSSTLAGRGEWKKTTTNNPNGNSYPVAAGNSVVFSGAREMLVMDTATGNINNQIALDINSTHMFGRRVVPFGNSFIHPQNNSLLISSLAKAASEEIIDLPVECGMTPAVWGNYIVIADIEGSVKIINPSTNTIDASINTSVVQPIALSMTISEDTGYFADRNGTVVAVDLGNKRVLWESKIGASEARVFTDLVYGSGNIFAYTGSRVFAFNMQTGREVFPSVESTCAPGYINGKLYYGNNNGDLIEANAATGATLKTVEINNGYITTRPAFAENKIVVGTSTGKIIVLNPEVF